MRFKVEALRNEFWILTTKMRKILCDFDYFCQKEFRKSICLTSLIRRDNKSSVHAYGRGTDVRSWDFTQDEIAAILEYINRQYPYGKSEKDTIMYHDAGSGNHFHVQAIHEPETK